MKKMIKELIPYIIILVVILIIKTFLIAPVRVDGPSMDNTLANNQILILNKLDKNITYGDIIVFNYKEDKLIKRVIGLPGDTVDVKSGNLYVNDKFVVEDYISSMTNDFSITDLGITKVPNNTYFVMGDNRYVSFDSRYFGVVKEKEVIGTIIFRIFPFNKFGSIK